ncbi:MAG: NUDIX domain-containing protein [Oscillospiraceae bacterium]|nr:NUDIX domain-containing protein [Oscillospiraceae bacterium]
MELKDKNGLTEAEFLAAYKPGNYPRPSVTADNLIFAEDNGKFRLLMIKRGGHPYLGMWALPGGFSNPNETVDAAAARELEEETGITNLHLEQVRFVSTPNRDPRTWVMTCAFMAVVNMDDVKAEAADDADDVYWFEIGFDGNRLTLSSDKEVLTAEIKLKKEKTWVGERFKAEVISSYGIAFDHAEIIIDAMLKLKRMGIDIF